jgi:hypothetical protein
MLRKERRNQRLFLTERNELEVSKVLTVYGRRITGGPQEAGVPGLEEKPKIQAEWVPHVRFFDFTAQQLTGMNRSLTNMSFSFWCQERW